MPVEKNENRSQFYNRIILIFTVGFLAGVILVYVGQQAFVINSGFLDGAVLQQLRSLEADHLKLFQYSLRERLWPAGCLIIMTFAGAGGLTVCIYLIWSGLCAGVILSVLSVRYGILGVLIFAGGIFPQAFLLVPAYVLLFEWCISFSAKDRTDARGKGKGPVRLGVVLTVLILLLTGCFAESYLNPVIIDKMFESI